MGTVVIVGAIALALVFVGILAYVLADTSPKPRDYNGRGYSASSRKRGTSGYVSTPFIGGYSGGDGGASAGGSCGGGDGGGGGGGGAC